MQLLCCSSTHTISLVARHRVSMLLHIGVEKDPGRSCLRQVQSFRVACSLYSVVRDNDLPVLARTLNLNELASVRSGEGGGSPVMSR